MMELNHRLLIQSYNPYRLKVNNSTVSRKSSYFAYFAYPL